MIRPLAGEANSNDDKSAGELDDNQNSFLLIFFGSPRRLHAREGYKRKDVCDDMAMV